MYMRSDVTAATANHMPICISRVEKSKNEGENYSCHLLSIMIQLILFTDTKTKEHTWKKVLEIVGIAGTL